MNYYLEMNLEQLQKEHAELLAFNENLDRERNKYRDDARKYAKKVQMIASLFVVPCDDPELMLKAIKTIVEQVRGGEKRLERGGDQNLKNTAQTNENTAFEGGDQKASRGES
ncbi:hypothetical protein [Acinetobacter radioresistens]|uniref:hypothetical protein n=1 Tax=Acinetobacter radioresistens TaxID=40216 RepID=UPI000A72CEDF|nr:hypothetical protein [Acinetobacter radioresistens]